MCRTTSRSSTKGVITQQENETGRSLLPSDRSITALLPNFFLVCSGVYANPILSAALSSSSGLSIIAAITAPWNGEIVLMVISGLVIFRTGFLWLVEASLGGEKEARIYGELIRLIPARMINTEPHVGLLLGGAERLKSNNLREYQWRPPRKWQRLRWWVLGG